MKKKSLCIRELLPNFCSQYVDLVIFGQFSGNFIVIFSSIYLVVSHVDNHVCESYMCKSDTDYFFIQYYFSS